MFYAAGWCLGSTDEFYCAGQEEWRGWLVENHNASDGVWLVFYKKHTGKKCISYEDAVDEALCFGWIDSIVKRVDDERYLRKFTPRKSGSVWSEANKRRVERLILEGRMTKVGLSRVKEAKESGEWFKRRVRAKELKVPPSMEKALKANKKALENFKSLAPSHRRQFVGWVVNAKREKTRKRRLTEAIGILERGEKLGLK